MWGNCYPRTALIAVALASAISTGIVALKLDSKFYDLFSLSHIYAQVKYGETAQLRAAYLNHHTNENTARLLFALARAFTHTGIKSQAEYESAPYLTSGLAAGVCSDDVRYQRHQQIDIPCHFRAFVTCVEGVLQRPDICLMGSATSRSACPQSSLCNSAYSKVTAEESRTWLQLWAEETMMELMQHQNNTPAQIAAMPRKSCLHDSQFLSAVYNMALCSELSRQASLSRPRIVHPLVEIYCPDPCLRNPCNARTLRHQLVSTECSSDIIRWESQHAIGHRWDDLQLQQEHNIGPQYTCKCRYGRWSSAKRVCERISGADYRACSPHLANKHAPCDAEGTSTCYDNHDSEEVPFMCRCKEGFVGVFCQKRIETCMNSVMEVKLQGVSRRMTGNRMCNVNHGGEPIANKKKPQNTCQPNAESLGGYNCTCVEPFYRLIPLLYDNCLGVRRACDTELCVNGECISTPDLMTASACHCYEGWAGALCNRQLEDWSIWSGCKPVCGANRTRHRKRLGDRRQSGRLYVETEVCSSRVCNDDTNVVDFTTYQTLMHSSSADSAALAGCAVFSLLSFAILRFWRPRFAAREFHVGN